MFLEIQKKTLNAVFLKKLGYIYLFILFKINVTKGG